MHSNFQHHYILFYIKLFYSLRSGQETLHLNYKNIPDLKKHVKNKQRKAIIWQIKQLRIILHVTTSDITEVLD